MLSLLERNISALENRLVLLAPPHAEVPGFFGRVVEDATEHSRLVREMQRLRGRIYADDGAIRDTDLSQEGLHQTPEDARSWHFLIRNAEGRVSSCAWYLEHDNHVSIDALRVRNCPLRHDPKLGSTFERAVQRELDVARQEGLRFAEVGGWAVSKECRCTSEGLLLAMAGYGFGRALGNGIGLTTATIRHSSSTILRRIGGRHLRTDHEVIPSYYDSRYDCQMELLRFDSRQPSPRFEGVIEAIRERLRRVPVVAVPQTAVRAVLNKPSFEAVAVAC